ncbi:Predicted arabinose efflux permease, MFS family [Cohaesibacter sp. ES.047]|uniref:MFS transporter n=1 Tax=Cohaesibacter sp. ES.047 TaxID=1798205 RepID=UPI000BB709A9|nr:MFS transporter [Cohaesibacter sp. ES.047]SNY89990.1 Predicted arabinose efflux permease, MFS family [Cohaesibacter sp. ES.047]
MSRSLLSIASLLLGSAFLFFAGGLTGVLLPVRGGMEGFSSFSLGLLGTGWAIGHISGCLFVPKIVVRTGHIRAFSVMAAIACLSVMASSLAIFPLAWIILRAMAGFAFAGAAMIVESWLVERTETETRGMIFGSYAMVNLFASTIGQMVIAVGSAESFHLFTLAAIFYVIALLPTALTKSPAPAPLAQVKLDVKGLWRNSPIAVVAVILTGVSQGSFGTLAAVYGKDIGLDLTSVALFVSASILAGAVAQIPVGYLSDRMDRRLVVVGIALVAIGADFYFLLDAPDGPMTAVIHSAIFGSAIFAFYPVLVAHANDHASGSDGMQISGGLLLLFGIGSMFGPFAGGILMSMFGPAGLFYSTTVPHVMILAFAIWRMTQRTAVEEDDKTAFVPIAPMRTRTPQTIVLGDDELTEEYSEDIAI